jgi:hypothetical protein
VHFLYINSKIKFSSLLGVIKINDFEGFHKASIHLDTQNSHSMLPLRQSYRMVFVLFKSDEPMLRKCKKGHRGKIINSGRFFLALIGRNL